MKPGQADSHYMRLALALALRGYGATSPNPMVGALLLKGGRIIGTGWHHRAGHPHAEMEALACARQHGYNPRGATLYVTLEPCSTQGRTPPCTQALIAAGIRSVIAGATDPNPRHRGKGFQLLKKAGIKVTHGVLASECEALNEAFNHWVVGHSPFVLVKAAMTLDGKIATPSGESKWITGQEARAYAMHLRRGSDAVLVGINTILADNPSLTVRDRSMSDWPPVSLLSWSTGPTPQSGIAGLYPASGVQYPVSSKRRLVLDTYARTPLSAKIVIDADACRTTIIVGERAPKARVKALAQRVAILVAPLSERTTALSPTAAKLQSSSLRGKTQKPIPHLDLHWLLKTLGAQNITQLLVEGGGEVNASFLLRGLAHRVAFFFAPKILGGRNSFNAVAGLGPHSLDDALELTELACANLGPDWLLTARVSTAN